MAKGNSAPTKASKQEKQVIEALSNLLADSYTLYLKTHNYHWNVSGPMFTTLHTLFETQYTELALADDSDTVAETAGALVASAQKAGDEASADLGIRRIQVAQKNAWMLRSHLA